MNEDAVVVLQLTQKEAVALLNALEYVSDVSGELLDEEYAVQQKLGVLIGDLEEADGGS